MNPMIALCMVVKDEEDRLARAIASAGDWVDDLIVVDTGSAYGMVEIGREAGALVRRFEFEDRITLGAARSYSLGLAGTEFAL